MNKKRSQREKRLAFQRRCDTRLQGMRDTMPPKMMIDKPWPMPCSVISSPSQIANMVPAVMVMIVTSVGRMYLRPVQSPTWG